VVEAEEQNDNEITTPEPVAEAPNWMLVLVCAVVSLTALWEAVGAGRQRVWLDMAGYIAVALSGALFALQTALGVRRPELGLRLLTPAVYLTLAGVFMLLLSQSSGRRL
jgi:tryptophan-rich sensory protein